MSTAIVLILLTLLPALPCAPVQVSWDRYVETGSITPNTTSLHPQSVFTVPFASPKTNALYSYSYSIVSLYQEYCNEGGSGRYSLFIKNQGMNTDRGMTLSVGSALNNTVAAISVRFLIVESNFTFMQIEHFSQYFPGTAYDSAWLTNTRVIAGSNLSSVSNDETLVTALNGYDIRDNSGSNQEVAIDVSASIASPTTIDIRFRSQYSKTNYLFYLGVDIIIVHAQLLATTFPRAQISSVSVTRSNNDNSGLNPTVPDNLLYYGITMLAKKSPGNRPFDFQVSNSPANFNIAINNAYDQKLTAGRLSFISEGECPPGKYWSMDSLSCQNCYSLFPDCLQCNSTTCFSCTNSSYTLQANACLTCDQVHPGCSECDPSGCTTCTSPYLLNGTFCFLCQDIWPNCNECDPFLCTNCSAPFVVSQPGIGAICVTCEQRWPGCVSCTSAGCNICHGLYFLNGSASCEVNCSLLSNCTACQVNSADGQLQCLVCGSGFMVVNRECVPECGDGVIIYGQECDDSNRRDRDGCSSSCQVEQYFVCSNMPSVCLLSEMNVSVVAMTKTEGKNQVLLTLELNPKGVAFYDSAKWIDSFGPFSHDLTANQVQFDPSTDRLRLSLTYSQNIHNQNVNFLANFTSASSSFNLTALALTLPPSTSNNQALYHYPQSTYTMAKVVRFGSMAVAAMAVVMLLVGYFGCKLQSLEAIAVVQVSALLVMTVKDTGPTFQALKNISYSLGITHLSQNSYHYEDSTDIPPHIQTILQDHGSLNINIFLILLILPLLAALALKVASCTIAKQNLKIEKSYKYALGTFTYYGMLFLAYGQFACLALSLRYFQTGIACLMGIAIGIAFTALLVLWAIASKQYPVWFGSFKNKFRKYQISSYFYTFSSTERLLTASLIVCLSPGFISSLAACLIFALESIFITVNKPYALDEWKRPLFNKICSSVICLLFLAAALTSADSQINQFLPLAVLLILLAVVIVGSVASAYQLKEQWQTKEDRQKIESKYDPPMTVEEAQAKLMQQFQMKLMPSLSQTIAQVWRPVEHDPVDIDRWKWQNYPFLSNYHQKTKLKQKVAKMPVCSNKEPLILAENKEKTRMQMYHEI